MKAQKKAAPTGHGNVKTHTKIQKKSPYRKSLAVKELERLAYEEARRKIPEKWVEWCEPAKFRDDKVEGLIACVITYLKLKNHWAERQKPNSCLEIVSAIIDGRSVKVLPKTKKDWENSQEKEFRELVENNGSIFFTASTFEDFLTWYNANF